MKTECSRRKSSRQAQYEQMLFSFAQEGSPVRLVFDGDEISSDAGWLPLRELDERLGLTAMAAEHLEDCRDPEMVVHPLLRLIREAVYARAAGYEDGNDLTPLREETLFKAVIGGINEDSRNPKKQSGAASEATYSRLLTGRKLDGRESFGLIHVEQFLRVLGKTEPSVLTLGIDGYGAPVHGEQQLALFNGYFNCDLFYPLHVTIAEYGFVVGVMLRPGNAGAATGALGLLSPIVEALRDALPRTKLRLRGDSGFSDPILFEFAEEEGLDYAFRLRMNDVLKRRFEELLDPLGADELPDRDLYEHWSLHEETMYQARSWPAPRRTLLKLTWNQQAQKFERYALVSNSRKSSRNVWRFYQRRGQEEQRIDEFKNDLRGEKFSSSDYRANCFRIHLMAMSYNLFAALRIVLSPEHELKAASVGRLRTVLIKCGALVKRTVRWLWVHASRNWPFRAALQSVCRAVLGRRLKPTPIWNSG